METRNKENQEAAVTSIRNTTLMKCFQYLWNTGKVAVNNELTNRT